MSRKSRPPARSMPPRAPSPGTLAAREPAELWPAALGAFRAGRLDEAQAGFEAILAAAPAHAPSHHLLGLILFARGRGVDAIAHLRYAVALDPNLAQAENDLGVALQLEGHNADAVVAYRRALALAPANATFHYNLASALQGAGDLEGAIAAYRAALALVPAYAEARVNLGNALLDQGRLEEARAEYRVVLDADPKNTEALSNLLRALNYDERLSPEAMLEAHRTADAAMPTAPARFANSPEPERRLRVGFVSPDFRTHSVAYFVEPLLASLDRASIESFCYASLLRPDATTARLKGMAGHWLDIYGVPDAAIAERVRADGIDILIDLAGHTAGNRLGLFAHRPAPVQATWCGYCNTTGLGAIDWRVTDGIADPAGAERRHSERLVRLPHGFLCYAPDADASPVSPLPARDAGRVTFGSFNALPKLSEATLRLWAQILDAVPGSRLLLKAPQLRDRGARGLLMERLASAGVAAERVELAPSVPTTRAHLALYGRVDLALDPFPYNGTATTCEALWMGVPVVTLAGRVHAGRVGASLLAAAGLPELVAATEADYVARAAALARDLDRLEALRLGMRDRLAASPLLDRTGFARDFEGALRAMWRDWCARQAR